MHSFIPSLCISDWSWRKSKHWFIYILPARQNLSVQITNVLTSRLEEIKYIKEITSLTGPEGEISKHIVPLELFGLYWILCIGLNEVCFCLLPLCKSSISALAQMYRKE